MSSQDLPRRSEAMRRSFSSRLKAVDVKFLSQMFSET